MLEWLVAGGLFVVGIGLGVVIGKLRATTVSAARIAAAEERARANEQRLTEVEAEVDRERLAATDANKALAAAESAIQKEREGLAEQRKLLDEAQAKLTEAFKAASTDALELNNKHFLELAKAALDKTLEASKGDLKERQEQIEGMVKPIRETLTKYEYEIKELEEKRQKGMAALGEQVKLVGEASDKLSRETSSLVHALRRPQARGRWGEVTLRRVVELAGMTKHCDFDEQASVTTEDRRLRPDLVVRLPGDRVVVVDAKVSLDAYLDLHEAADEAARRDALKRHAQQVRKHVDQLASKSYGTEFADSAEFTIMFLPNEAIFGAAVEQDPELVERAMDKRVVLATPMTLVAILRTVEHGWRQHGMEENAQRINELGRELYDRLVTMSEHFAKVGTHLGRSVESFNKAIGSYETRVMVTARRFQELGAGTSKVLESAEPVSVKPRLGHD